jgi:hypothetical protein
MKNECAGTQPPCNTHKNTNRVRGLSGRARAPLTLAFLWNEIRIINSRSYKVLPAPREGFVCVCARAIKIKNSYARALFFLHSSILLLPGRERAKAPSLASSLSPNTSEKRERASDQQLPDCFAAHQNNGKARGESRDERLVPPVLKNWAQHFKRAQ